ncbi:MAG: protein kinase [Candidatus Obscuribacterales bacterium]|nr:protein kinase [Candidatus Obscuribacterales bacterium]
MVNSTEHLHDNLERKYCLECHRKYTGIIAACPHDNSMLVPLAQDPLLGTKLAGKYEILEHLGTGGMGVVYKGRQDVMDRIVAIKMLQSHHLGDSMSVKRFQQEGRHTCKLNHPHIITVYDFGISQQTGQPYIVMDYLQGVALADVIRQEGQVKVDRALKLFMQAAEALGHAHKQGIIHRDLKPSNIILISYDGDKDFVKVVDFGVAQIMEDVSTSENHQRLTQMGEVCGSPVYMSPEQCQGDKLDQRSDIYSMGIVMYETLTNRLPLIGRTMVETMRKQIEELPPPFSDARPDLYIPERVEQVVLKALAKNPEHRHQSMEHLLDELEQAIPRPGRSQVLRTAPIEVETSAKVPPTELISTMLFKLTWAQWACVLVAVVTIGALVIVGLYTMVSGGTAPTQTVTEQPITPTATPTPPPPAAPDVSPPVVTSSTTPTTPTTTTTPATTTASTRPKSKPTPPAPIAVTPPPAVPKSTQTAPHPKSATASTTRKVSATRPKKVSPVAKSNSRGESDALWKTLVNGRTYRTGHMYESK